jgi:hypothetical protein
MPYRSNEDYPLRRACALPKESNATGMALDEEDEDFGVALRKITRFMRWAMFTNITW